LGESPEVYSLCDTSFLRFPYQRLALTFVFWQIAFARVCCCFATEKRDATACQHRLSPPTRKDFLLTMISQARPAVYKFRAVDGGFPLHSPLTNIAFLLKSVRASSVFVHVTPLPLNFEISSINPLANSHVYAQRCSCNSRIGVGTGWN